MVLPSSQVSVPAIIPFAHFWQTDWGDPFQVHPVSTAHDELHPSLFDVLPSSQPSVPSIFELPHLYQTEGTAVYTKFGSHDKKRS